MGESSRVRMRCDACVCESPIANVLLVAASVRHRFPERLMFKVLCRKPRAHVVGAANGRGLLNPMVVVQGQIYQIVNGGPTVNDLLHGWTVVGHNNSVMYSGPRGLQETPFLLLKSLSFESLRALQHFAQVGFNTLSRPYKPKTPSSEP